MCGCTVLFKLQFIEKTPKRRDIEGRKWYHSKSWPIFPFEFYTHYSPILKRFGASYFRKTFKPVSNIDGRANLHSAVRGDFVFFFREPEPQHAAEGASQ